jgi:hypothetical protein
VFIDQRRQLDAGREPGGASVRGPVRVTNREEAHHPLILSLRGRGFGDGVGPDTWSHEKRQPRMSSMVEPEVAYYYPQPFWRMGEADELKGMLLFFDRIAILLPRYMRGRERAADPVLAGPTARLG